MSRAIRTSATRRAGLWLAALACATMLMQLALPAAASAGAFNVRCEFSHRKQDDPIVHRGHAGMAHWHDFFGGRDADADSTYQSMIDGETTCSDQADKAGYWHPRLRFKGKARKGTLFAYYSRNGKPTVRPYPRNLRIIAGKATATKAQSKTVTYWRCVDRGALRRYKYVPACREGERLSGNIVFPDCWDGDHLDSADHASHMAYSRKGACPATHPEMLPRLVMTVVWNIRPTSPDQVELSSGSRVTMHADFWNTWRQGRLRALTNRCLNIEENCGRINHAG
jgi:hypothetical protein